MNTMTRTRRAVDRLDDENGPAVPFILARMAGTGDPDSHRSDGAQYLLAVLDEVQTAIEDDNVDEATPTRVADTVVTMSTFAQWRVFVDLALWSDAAYDETDAASLAVAAKRDGLGDQLTFTALYGLATVAERLARALLAEVAPEVLAEPEMYAADYGFTCEDFDEDGTCIHSDHMMKAGM